MPDIVSWRGSRFDQRTLAQLREAERISGLTVSPTQGSYNTSVSASAGSHDRGGAADLSVRNLNHAERAQLVAALRRVGMAAWLRQKSQGFSMDHIHAISVGCPDLAPLAASQVQAYKRGRNGLRGDGPDDGPRQWVNQTWETYQQTQQQPRPRRAPDMITIKSDTSATVYLLGVRGLAGIGNPADLKEIRKALADPTHTATVSQHTLDSIRKNA